MTKGAAQFADLTQYRFADQDILDELPSMLADAGGTTGLNPFDLPTINMPTSGGQLWTIPSPLGEQSAKSIVGIIVKKQTPRSYWAGPPEETLGRAPDCSSMDGVVGHGTPGGDCATCEFSKFGTARRGTGFGRGQACKAMTWLYILTPDVVMPLRLTLAPTGVAVFRKYLVSLASVGLLITDVVTEITLEKVKSADGIGYSKPAFRSVEVISREQKPLLNPYRAIKIMGLLPPPDAQKASTPQLAPATVNAEDVDDDIPDIDIP